MPLFLPKISAMGIDLSDLSVKVAYIKKGRKEKMVLTSLGEKDIPKSFINDGIIDPEKEGEVARIIKEAIQGVKGKKIKTKKAICSLPEENSFIKILQIPESTEEEMGEVIKWQIESNFPVRLKDIYFDWEVIKPPKKNNKISKNKKNKNDEQSLIPVSVAVIPKRIVNSYFSVFKKADLEPIAFEIESMAVVRALLGEYSQSPVIILDIGRCGTGLTIVSGNAIFFTSHIDISGQSFDESISKSLKIDLKKAEELKKEVGLLALGKKETLDLKPFKNSLSPSVINDIKKTKGEEIKIDPEKGSEIDAVFNALVPALTDFSEQVQHYIDYFSDLNTIDFIPDGKIQKIILCGGESKIMGLPDFLSSSLKMPVEVGNLLYSVSPIKEISKDSSFWDFLSYATVIGLAKRGSS